MIQLYIENNLVDKTENVDFPINYTYENLNSPTDIVVTWSKSIKIPFSEKNDALFGRIFLPERLTAEGDSNIGIYFNPHKKVSFKLIDGEILLISGYAKMSEINSTAKTYTINLTGESANILTELLKYNYKSSDLEYQLNDIIEEAFQKTAPAQQSLNAWTIKNCWEHSYDYNTSLNNPYDIFGFAATYLGLYENFKSDSFILKDENNNDIVKTFDIELLARGRNYKVGSLDEHLVNLYRSYHLKPFIMVNKIFQHLQLKASDLGYTMLFHPAWFNVANPYYTKLAVVMSDLVTANKEESTDSINGSFNWRLINNVYINNSNYIVSGRRLEDCVFGVNRSTTTTINLSSSLFKNRTIILELPKLYLSSGYRLNAEDYVSISPYVEFLVTIYDNNNTILTSQNFKYSVDDREGYTTLNSRKYGRLNFFYNGISTNFMRYDFQEYRISQLEFDINNSSLDNVNLLTLKIEVLNRALNQITIFSNLRFDNIFKEYQRDNLTLKQYLPIVRTGVKVSMKLLWNILKTPMQVLLDYCKMFNLSIIINELTLNIIILPKSTYFRNPTILDWSDKLDKSKDFIINSHIFDSKFMRLGYKDNNSELIKQYSEEVGNLYGDIILTTPYEFNDKTNTLLEGLENFIESNRAFTSWELYRDYTGTALPSTQSPNYFLFDLQNSNRKSANLSNLFAFVFDIENSKSFYITDDISYEVTNKQFMYHDLYTMPNTYLTTTKAKTLSNNIEVDSLIYGLKYNLPQRIYYSLITQNNFLRKWICSPETLLYERIWKDYLTERYNRNNKKVTCYLHITNDDITDFLFNQFIVIDGVLYFINKIIDFNPNNDETTKVELLTVLDISKYSSETIFGEPEILLYVNSEASSSFNLGALLPNTPLTAIGWGNLLWLSGVNIISNNNYIITGSSNLEVSTTRQPRTITIDDVDYNILRTYTYYSALPFKPHTSQDGTSVFHPVDKVIIANVVAPSYNNGIYTVPALLGYTELIIDNAWETSISSPTGDFDSEDTLVIKDSLNVALFYVSISTTTDSIPQTLIYIERSTFSGESEEVDLVLHSPYSEEDIIVKLQIIRF